MSPTGVRQGCATHSLQIQPSGTINPAAAVFLPACCQKKDHASCDQNASTPTDIHLVKSLPKLFYLMEGKS